MRQSVVLVLFAFITLVLSQRPVTVHVIPHSHDDAGWLMTMDEYFNTQVKSILDTVTQSLTNNPKLTFHQVEQIYFNKWWKQATAKQQQQFRDLYTRGQVEFLNGGWVMHDDAVTTYSAMIDQTTLGHQFINDLFGAAALPRTGWTVDPFGVSSVTAKINKAFRQDYHVVSRLSFEVKDKMKKDGDLDFLWRFDPTHDDDKHQILTHVWWDMYCTPGSMYWDDSGEPVTDANVKKFADQFVNAVKLWQSSYKSGADHILFPFGCDFMFKHADRMYGNMSKVIDYINNNEKSYNLNVKYSKVSEYMNAIFPTNSPQPNYQFTKIGGDFFPYADNIESFWTGYFVSRAEVKNMARFTERVSREGEILFALARSYGVNLTYSDNYDNLYALRYANGLVQHHDGITGTERVPVVANYLEYLVNGLGSANNAISKSLLALLAKNPALLPKLTLSSILQDYLGALNDGDVVPLIVFNSLAWDRQGTIKVLINKQNVVVKDAEGVQVKSQILSIDTNQYELSFTTGTTIPALGFSVYFIYVSKTQTPVPHKIKELKDATISNSIYDLTYNSNGDLFKVKNKRDNFEVDFSRQYLTYDSYTGPGQASGAYIFRSTGPEASPLTPTGKNQHVEGDVSHVVKQTITPYIKETVRLYKNNDKDATSAYGEANVIEFNLEVGPLPGNKEAIIRFNTNIKSKGEIVTDNNGLQSFRRHYRNWPNDQGQRLYPTSSNYYPFVYHASINDDDYQLTIVTNSSRGVASLKDGSIEVMIHRRCLVDDGRGVSDPMNDVAIVGLQLRVIIEKKQQKDMSVLRANQAHRANYPLDGFVFQNLDQKIATNFTALFRTNFNPLNVALPNNVHLLSFAQQNVNGREATLLRAVNLEQLDPTVNTVDFSTLFKDLKVVDKTVTTLNGVVPETTPSDFRVSLEPLEIKTYVAKFSRK
jgi:hypothetical protein